MKAVVKLHTFSNVVPSVMSASPKILQAPLLQALQAVFSLPAINGFLISRTSMVTSRPNLALVHVIFSRKYLTLKILNFYSFPCGHSIIIVIICWARFLRNLTKLAWSYIIDIFSSASCISLGFHLRLLARVSALRGFGSVVVVTVCLTHRPDHGHCVSMNALPGVGRVLPALDTKSC